jgi:hypothetical protein
MMHDATICKKMLHEAALAGTWCRNAMHASAMFVVLDLPPNITCRTTRHTVKKDLTFVVAVRKDSFRKLFEPYTCRQRVANLISNMCGKGLSRNVSIKDTHDSTDIPQWGETL